MILTFLPSAQALPSIVRSQARAASKNALSSAFSRSSFLNSYDSQSGATSTTGPASCPRRMSTPLTRELLASPSTPIEPNRYLRDASRRLKKPPMRLEDMNTCVSSSGYLKSTRQMEKPSLSKLDHYINIEAHDICRYHSLLVEPL